MWNGARLLAQGVLILVVVGCTRSRATERDVVLCIGDSFTDGAGVDGPSKCYPAALSRQLEEAAPGRFLVVQRSYPGGDSRRLLLDLPAVLARVRPFATYVLVGMNDGYSMPDEVAAVDVASSATELDSEGAAVLRCFVGGSEVEIEGLSVSDPGWVPLARIGADDATLSAPEFVGAWHFAAESIEFGANGELHTRFGKFTWQLVDGRLVVAGNGAVIEMKASRDGSRLVLANSGGEPLITLSPGPSDIAAKQVDLAARRAEFGSSPNWISALWLARAERDADRIEDAAEHCAWIVVRAEFNYPARELLRSLARDPTTRERCLSGLARAHTAIPENDALKASYERLDAMFRVDADPDGAARGIVSAFGRDADWRATIRLLRNEPAIDADRLARAAETAGVDEDTKQAIQTIHATLDQVDDRVARTIRSHLRTIASLCREAGSELAILDYPARNLTLESAFAGLERDTNCRKIDVAAWFAVQSPEERAHLIDPDGHCAAEGYDAMARLVAADLLADR